MPLVEKKYLQEDCLFGLWKITEDYDELLTQVILVEQDIERLNGFKNQRRKQESLSVRALLSNLTYPGARIIYDEKRKPFLLDSSHHISISHSRDYTAILLSRERRIGIDLEYMSHDIARVSSHFLTKDEYITPDPGLSTLHMYIHWCAKEALYKICDKKDIIFNQNLTILPFEPSLEGQMKGIHHGEDFTEIFDLSYWVDGNYVIVYCLK